MGSRRRSVSGDEWSEPRSIDRSRLRAMPSLMVKLTLGLRSSTISSSAGGTSCSANTWHRLWECSFSSSRCSIRVKSPPQSHRPGKPPAPGPGKPPVDHEKRAKQLTEQIDQARTADHWDKAIARAEELVAIRKRVDGPKHFVTANAEWRLAALRRVAPMAGEDRAAYQSARSMNVKAETLYAQGNYTQAQPLFEKSLEIRRRLLGENPLRMTSASLSCPSRESAKR